MTKLISIILIITLVPMLCVGTQEIAFASDKITPYPPETKQTPAIKDEIKEEKPVSNWWYVIGLALIVGVAAAAGGGAGGGSSGSSGSSSTGGSESSGTGTVNVGWK